jgi:hypothetical protein
MEEPETRIARVPSSTPCLARPLGDARDRLPCRLRCATRSSQKDIRQDGRGEGIVGFACDDNSLLDGGATPTPHGEWRNSTAP